MRKQTNKIDPVLDQSNYKPGFVDQLVESYIADIILFLMELLGPKRAENFKRVHLQLVTPTPPRIASEKHFGKDADDLVEASHFKTAYAGGHVPIMNSRSRSMSGIDAMDTGGRNHSLPEINRSLDLASESKRRHSNKGVKLVDPVQLQAA